ncbi:peptidase domain-containing ABC transporter [Paenimyroides viscosum]|uniref:Peptidase domain-containing ABC transporter n=1 Tax=Paenimyroides viscosum TaxID=2488729 RepID=A0A3P1B4K9_9FLAO|nr:peptidase domain-containing ABC transporter [Paenimyroides viscosum]RRA95583.1 peptidase domain-containing ABC transporter [Paenimyroides viscosum]
MKLKFISQHDQMDCGPACLSMIVRYYGKKCSLQYIRNKSFLNKEGVSVAGISHAARSVGLIPGVFKLNLQELEEISKQGPSILHWNQNHFVVLIDIKHKRGKRVFKIADPGYGIMSVKESEFVKHWLNTNEEGIMITFKLSENFHSIKCNYDGLNTLKYIKGKLKTYRWRIITIFIAVFITSCCTLIFPFITQAVVDKGISQKDISLVASLLLAHAFIFIGATVVDVIRNWITLYLGTKINIEIISDFLKKALRLPISFFDSKQKGDFNQRILDQQRIETFLTTQSIITIFSIVNFVVFLGVLLYYSKVIVLAYSLLTVLAVVWSLLFINKLKTLDYNKFQLRSENQDTIYEFVNGIEEIKLNNLEEYKRSIWEKVQLKLFGANIRVLKTIQFQTIGFDLINQLKNILVTFLSAKEVINGSLSLGAMLSIAFIVGLMNSPISQLITFIRGYQEAKLSLDRLNEVQNISEESEVNEVQKGLVQKVIKRDICVNKLYFQYGSPTSKKILSGLSFTIPHGKVTAIVGGSGSGKTTLLKLLLKFYQPTEGEILFGEDSLNSFDPNEWRAQCGVVLQEGYIFSDTIKQNIICGEENPNIEKLKNAVRLANIESYINELPLGFNTKIGAAGNGLSGGQKQRLLIARAIYKNPRYIFFDEATSSLDAENEKIIHDNLQSFFVGKTVVVVAHRLSTVKNADQIIVLKDGEIAEIGTHGELIDKKSVYYKLIKNQLELGT